MNPIQKYKRLFSLLLIALFLTFLFWNPRRSVIIKRGLPTEYLLVTPGCAIQKLGPWDPSISRFFYKMRPHKCDRRAEDILVFQKEDGSLGVDPWAKAQLLGAESSSAFSCTKRRVYRNQWEEDDSYHFRLTDQVTRFVEQTPMDVEYAEIKCYAGNRTLYQNYFFYPCRKPPVEAESASNRIKHLQTHPRCSPDTAPPLSVLVLGLDSVSRSSLIRMLPNTWNYVMRNLSAIEMLGYNRVGLNTFPCLMPYMTGKSVRDLIEGCWGHKPSNTFDNCTFIFDIFAAAGYRTAFVENYDWFNMFYSNRGGFHRQLAHYNSHTIFVAASKAKLFHKACWRGEAEDQLVVDWALMFQRQFARDLHFGHFWTNLFSHNSHNAPQLLDPIVSGAFVKMAEEKLLEQTLLVFMSDHGLRYGEFRETEMGQQEENFPFMYLIFPDWFRERFPEAVERVRENGERLVTTFDLHETLKSVVACDYTATAADALNSDVTARKKRGVSLFTPISEFRTCAEAGIPDVFCGCAADTTDLNSSSERAVELGRMTVEHLNARTETVREKCAKYSLSSVLYAKTMEAKSDYNNNNGDDDEAEVINSHIIGVLVNPGGAKFEATIQKFRHNSTYWVNSDIRRINRYGNSSDCVIGDAFLRTICNCVSL